MLLKKYSKEVFKLRKKDKRVLLEKIYTEALRIKYNVEFVVFT